MSHVKGVAAGVAPSIVTGPSPNVVTSIDEIVELIDSLDPARRIIVGITGPPGAGKSTIGESVVERIGERISTAAGPLRPTAMLLRPTAMLLGPTAMLLRPTAMLLGLDGFHLPQARLVELGRRDRMGAADTFDVDAFVDTLTNLRFSGAAVLAPGFDREIEESVPDAIAVPPEKRVLVVEGNYLLHDAGGWGRVAPLLDLTFFVQLDRDIRLQRLVKRHVRFGKSPDAAAAWANGPDEANARLIEASSGRADHLIELD